MNLIPVLSGITAAVVSAVGVTAAARALVPIQAFQPPPRAAQSLNPPVAADFGCWVVAVDDGRIAANWQAPCSAQPAALPYEGSLAEGERLRLPQRSPTGPIALRANSVELRAALSEGYEAGALLWLPVSARFGYVIAAGQRDTGRDVKAELWGVMPERIRLRSGVIYGTETLVPKKRAAPTLAPALRVLEPPQLAQEVIELPEVAPVVTVDVAAPAKNPEAGGINGAPRARELAD